MTTSGWTFVEKTMYSEGGVFRSQRPAKNDETFDLSGKYVIPPLTRHVSACYRLVTGVRDVLIVSSSASPQLATV